MPKYLKVLISIDRQREALERVLEDVGSRGHYPNSVVEPRRIKMAAP
jgi:hypothetical protein